MMLQPQTAFARSDFSRIWAETFGLKWEPLPSATEVGLVFSESRRLGLRRYHLGPRGLYWGGTAEVVDRALARCLSSRTLSLTWSFRYDDRQQLEHVRSKLRLNADGVVQSYSHVLPLENLSLDQLLEQRVKATTRRWVRRAERSGIAVRALRTSAEFAAHDAIYRPWARERDIDPYPAALFERLGRELGSSATLWGAFGGERLLAAALIFRDAREWFYWHGVRDPMRDRDHAMDGLFAHAVGQAIAAGARYFNMGASKGIDSLEEFKERWGAERVPVWSLHWLSPLWGRALGLKRLVLGESGT